MTIFQSYTGNAMLNNALMTIEALADLEKVQDITPAVINAQFQKYKFWELYKRMKSYTMLFTRNNLLTGNNKEGWKLYKALFERILDNVETQGKYQCEISGLRFDTTFSKFYQQTQRGLQEPEKEQGIDRCWFPLIGSLGSDAQALPQARFDVRIHPTCLVIVQFLPLSALLYKGSVLLFDTVNFDFARDFIAQNVERVREEINLTASGKQIENIKDSDKGKYLLRAIELFYRKQNRYGDRYTDLNLWSFTNSGTGASCEVDRIPSRFFHKLLHLFKTDCRPELTKILSGKGSGYFLYCFENDLDFPGLYPAKGFEGASIPFFEEYQRQIGRAGQLDFIKYVAGLQCLKTLSQNDEKLLAKTDAYAQEGYAPFFQKTLVEAAARGDWSLEHHLSILDDSEAVPVKNTTVDIFKKVHFYFQRHVKWQPVSLPDAANTFSQTPAGQVCAFSIRLIEMDANESHTKHAERLADAQKFEDWRIYPLCIRQAEQLELAQVAAVFCRGNRLFHKGLNHLLRLYFCQKEQEPTPKTNLPTAPGSNWLRRLQYFAEVYEGYYLEKYADDRPKFKKHVLNSFPEKTGEFARWLTDAFERMREFYKEKKSFLLEFDHMEETLCYDDDGNFNPVFARFAIEFCFNRNFKLQHISSL